MAFFCIHITGVRGIIGLDWAMSYGRVDTPYFIGIDAIAILSVYKPSQLTLLVPMENRRMASCCLLWREATR